MRHGPSLVVAIALAAAVVAFACVPTVASAVGAVTFTPGNITVFQELTSTWYVTGRVYNNSASPVTDVTLRVTFKNASNSAIGSQSCPVGVHVLDDSTFAWFCQRINPPAGTAFYAFSVTGVPVTTHARKAQIIPLPAQDDIGVARYYDGSIQGDAFETITGLLIYGDEWIDPPQFYSAAVDANHVNSVISPGATHPFSAIARRVTVQSPHLVTMWYEWALYSPRTVYRFYNKRTGTHFYTASEDEKATVINTLSAIYQYEGSAYSVNTASPSNMRPLYRFYNKRTGTHFYTASEAEKATVINTLGAIYQYDGPAYNVSTYPWYSRPAYRFYNRLTGTHFYTTNETEKATVINTLAAIYQYEGPAFYLAY